MSTYSDEYIEYWGKVFRANKLELRGFTFEQFLKNPQGELTAATLNDRIIEDDEPLPLLPKQQAVAERVERMEHANGPLKNRDALTRRAPNPMRVSNGRVIEPLRHNAIGRKHKPRRKFNTED